MRRLLTGPVGYLGGLAGATARGWNAFFFTPADPTALGLMRLAVGLLLFWNLLVYGLDLHAFLGSDGWASPEALEFFRRERTPWAWSLWDYVPDAWLRAAWVLGLVVLALFAAGLWSRVTAVLAWVVVVSTMRRAPASLYGFDQAVSTWALYLAATGASGQAVSLDRFLARWRAARGALARRPVDGGAASRAFPSGRPAATVSANLGLRLVQLHLCLIYGMSGLAKLQGAAWWNGTAVWGTLAAGEFRLFDLTWLAAFPWLLNLMTHGSLFLEIGYPVLIWVRPLRPLLIAATVALHAGIGLTLGLTEFGLAMVAGNLAFVSGPWLRGLVTGKDRAGPSARVLYDGACPRCRASMALATAGDPDRLVEPLDLTAVDVAGVHPSLTREACLRSMHLVRPDGRVFVGYDGVVALAGVLPLFWPVALFGRIPGVTWAGRKVYNALAASRPRDEPCTDEVCAIHPGAVRSPGRGVSPPSGARAGRKPPV